VTEYNCLESINSLYVQKTPSGYVNKPCCVWQDIEPLTYSKNIDQLLDNAAINEIREAFKGDWKRPECNGCIVNESMGKSSKRTRGLVRGADKGIVKWDLRPGHTCNLKCAMCNPWNSSKWYEDLNVYKAYNLKYPIGSSLERTSRESLDWDWIYSQCIDKAEMIYIAGGEPFYMKPVQTFLEKLSQHDWNRKHTVIQIQTNGVSNTDKFLKTLSKFERLEFSISIDGWGRVNEIIRFPTNHKVLVQNIKQLMALKTNNLYFNLTVQCMNLPNVDKTLTKLKEIWNGKYEIHNLTRPKHLSINCLKPVVIRQVKRTTQVPELKTFLKSYEYNAEQNIKMKEYLLALDEARGTNSQEVLPWCFK